MHYVNQLFIRIKKDFLKDRYQTIVQVVRNMKLTLSCWKKDKEVELEEEM